MPRNKDFKRLTRERMDKTGESYTAARIQLIKKRNPPEDEYVELGGMSDEAVRAKTGKTWKEWVEALDAINATSKPHKEIAQYLYDAHDGVSLWWAQTVTVGYERIRGLREIGQRRGGGFEVNKSRTIQVPVAELYEAWADNARRALWLSDADFEVRTATTDKSVRGRARDGTAVHAYFAAKGDAKSTVSVQHSKLSDKDEADEVRAFWTKKLSTLTALLTANGADT